MVACSTHEGRPSQKSGLQIVVPHKWSPVGCRSSARQGKFPGQRHNFLPLYTTQPTESRELLNWLQTPKLIMCTGGLDGSCAQDGSVVFVRPKTQHRTESDNVVCYSSLAVRLSGTKWVFVGAGIGDKSPPRQKHTSEENASMTKPKRWKS